MHMIRSKIYRFACIICLRWNASRTAMNKKEKNSFGLLYTCINSSDFKGCVWYDKKPHQTKTRYDNISNIERSPFHGILYSYTFKKKYYLLECMIELPFMSDPAKEASPNALLFKTQQAVPRCVSLPMQ